MAEDHAHQGVGECHPYREFEGVKPSTKMHYPLKCHGRKPVGIYYPIHENSRNFGIR